MRNYIGSGHISAIVRKSPWSNRPKVYYELTDSSFSIPLNDSMESGIFLESGIAAWWAYKTKTNIIKASTDPVLMPGKEFLGATPDFYIAGIDGQIEAILEVKNTGGHNGDKWEDDAPEHYIVQLLWQMHITGIHKGVLCACVGGNKLEWIDIDYDPDIGAWLEAEAVSFWFNHVIPKIPPPLDEADLETLEKVFKNISTGKEIFVPITGQDFENHAKWKADKAELEKKIEGFKARVRAELKDAEFAISNDLKYKVKRKKIEKKAFQVEARTEERLNITALTEKEIKQLKTQILLKEQRRELECQKT